MTTSAFPNYLEMRQPVPPRVWYALSALMVLSALGLIGLLFADPRRGLVVWWLWVLPVLPLVWIVAPGIWRNVCPMAALNQVPRGFGFTRALTVPAWLRKNTLMVQGVLYFALISTRAPLLDHNGPAVATLMLVCLGTAFVGGVVFKGKSGWCGTFCPLLPIQRLYGQTPAVVVPNAHCRPCVGCTKNCYDFNPRVAYSADAHDDDPGYVGQRKVFAGLFPGFVLGFFTIPASEIGARAHLGISEARYFGLMAVYMLVGLGIFYLLDALLPLSSVVLTAVFAAAALNIHNVLRFPTAFQWHKPGWVLALDYAAVAVVTVFFVVRTWRKERVLEGVAEADDLAASAAGALGATRAGSTVEVAFAPSGHRAVARRGATLLEVAEKAELPLEAGCRMGVCGADPIVVTAGGEGLSPVTAEERTTLERLGLGEGCRMACCARVTSGDLQISLDVAAAKPAPRAPVRIATAYDRSVERVVVIGNGIAGVTAADHVRRRHPECSIDVVAEELHPLYNRMGISRLIYGRTAMSGLHLLPDGWYDEHRVTTWLNTQVHAIDRDARTVALGTGQPLPYDRLILATGSSASLPPIEGIEQRGVFAVRSADDAGALRAYVQRRRSRSALVLGGGLLGLEAAYALHRLGLRVRVIHRAPALLTGQLDAHGGELLARYFEGLGIGVELDAATTLIEGGGTAEGLTLADGRTLPLDVLVVCAGIRANVELARAAGLEVNRGVVVDERMRTSDPLIYAAGDVAELPGQIAGLWPIAVAQAEVAAANVIGEERTFERRPPVTVLKGVGLDVTAAGAVEPEPGDETIALEGLEDELRYARLVVREGRAAGAVFIGSWPGSPAVLDAVASGADVRPALDALRAGDWSALEAA